MSYTYSKIASVTIGSTATSSIDFLAIPQNYTDLLIKVSCRTNGTGQGNSFLIALNSYTTSFTTKTLFGDSAIARTNSGTTGYGGVVDGTTETANTFSSTEIYIPNYTSNNYKIFSLESVSEDNAALTPYQFLVAQLWSNVSPINYIKLTPYVGSWVQHTVATLYGIKAEV